METEKRIAQTLLQINAIKLNPANPFRWASGWNSPIYCDNRKALSYPAARKEIYEAFTTLISSKYPDAEVIAGVATGAIAWGVLAAENSGKPFIYVRSSPKGHGMANQVEGICKPGQKVVVVEDLVSTGGSSLNAVEVLKGCGCEVLGMVAIFTYGFTQAIENFKKARVDLTTLSDYNALIELAEQQGYVKESELEALREWRKNPDKWSPRAL